MAMKQHDDAEIKRARDEWRAVRPKSPEELLAFFYRLNAYRHDYSTICHALGAGAVATARMLDAWLKQGGITGFQGSCVMWDFIAEWMGEEGKPLRLVHFEQMLYPQYASDFEKTITPDTWTWLQDEARKHLAKLDPKEPISGRVVEHWRAIADGVVPFGYVVEER